MSNDSDSHPSTPSTTTPKGVGHGPMPEFPLDSFPAWQRSMVEGVANATKTDPSVAAMMSLAVLSAAVGRKVIVETDSDFALPVNVWILVVLGTGQAKSRVFGSMVSPISEVQRALSRPLSVSTLAPAPPEAPEPRRPTAWAQLLEDPLGEPSDLEPAGVPIEHAIRVLREEQEAAHPNVGVDFLVDDLTPTALVEAAGSQVAGIAWLSPEGGFDAWIGRGPQGTNNMRRLNKAWDGDDIREGRVGAGRVAERPSLTMGVMVHPDAARAVLRSRAMAERGYSYRFLVLVPESRVGRAQGPFGRLSGDVGERYRRAIWSMMTLPSTVADGRSPCRVRLSAEANASYWVWFNRLQHRIREGDLHELHGWIEKMRVGMIRVSGLLHLAARAPFVGASAYEEVVTGESMEKAIAIGDYLIPHALNAFGVVNRPPAATAAVGAAPVVRVVSLLDALVGLVDGQEGRRWAGTATELLGALDSQVPLLQREAAWPDTAERLGQRLVELDDPLRQRGIARLERRSGKGRRVILQRAG